MPKPMDSGRAEFVFGLALTLLAMGAPLTWWLRASALVLACGFFADLAWRSPITIKYPLWVRIFAAVFIVLIIAAISWGPISAEFVKEDGFRSLKNLVSSNTDFFRLLLASIIGGLIGNQFAPARPKIRRRQRVVTWPNVHEWMSPSAALERFVDDLDLISNLQAARWAVDARQREYDKLRDARFEDQSPAVAAISALNDPQLSAALQKKSEADDALFRARWAIFEDLRRQLRNGDLVGRAVLHEPDRLPDDWEILRPSNWVVLTFDLSNLTTVIGAGKTYRGLEIGKHEASR